MRFRVKTFSQYFTEAYNVPIQKDSDIDSFDTKLDKNQLKSLLKYLVSLKLDDIPIAAGSAGIKIRSAQDKNTEIRDWTKENTPDIKISFGQGSIGKGGGVKISDANPKSQVDWIMLRSSETPGPNQYVINDTLTRPGTAGAVKISDANPKSDIDWIILNSSQTPGPNQYSPDKDISSRLRGGRFSNANPKSDLEWTIHNASETPGPNAYDVSLCPPPFIPPIR